MFSNRLRYLRTQKGKSQQNMADLLGITRQGYGKYEDGKSEPDHKTLVKLADYFDVSTDYLLGHETEENKLEYYKNKIVTEFPNIDLMFKDMESLTAEDMKEVYEYIKFKKSQKEDK